LTGGLGRSVSTGEGDGEVLLDTKREGANGRRARDLTQVSLAKSGPKDDVVCLLGP